MTETSNASTKITTPSRKLILLAHPSRVPGTLHGCSLA
jgi:hypothetical protein